LFCPLTLLITWGWTVEMHRNYNLVSVPAGTFAIPTGINKSLKIWLKELFYLLFSYITQNNFKSFALNDTDLGLFCMLHGGMNCIQKIS